MLRRNKPAQDTSAPAAPPGSEQVTYVEMALARVPIFQACSMDQLLRVAGVASVRELPAGQEVIREGDAGDEFFVILNGEVAVSRGGRQVATLTGGDFFGELALFDTAPRNATVTATQTVKLVTLTRAALQRVLDEAPIRDRILTGMARRLHELDPRVC